MGIWGWYYLSTVLDDYSRYIICWQLCPISTAEDVKALVERAIGLGILTSLNGAKANASALAFVRASRMLLIANYDINMKSWQIGLGYELIRF